MTPNPGRGQNSKANGPSDPQPYYGPEQNMLGRRILWVGRLLLVALIVAILVTFGIIWLNSHKVGEKTAKNTSSSSQVATQDRSSKTKEKSGSEKKAETQKSQTNQSSSKNTGTQGSEKSSTKTTEPSSSQKGTNNSPTTENIPNTGPGEIAVVATLFAVIASIAGNYFRQLKRLS